MIKIPCINILGLSLLCRFRHTGDIIDLDHAITAHQDVVLLTPEGHTGKARYLYNLGTSFAHCYKCTHNCVDFETAISQFQLSASSFAGDPVYPYLAACKWARLALEDNSMASLDGYDAAINFIPRVAWLGHTISA